MGITFPGFATPLERERQNCNARFTRTRAKSMIMTWEKMQYYIRVVAKIEKASKTSRRHKKHAIENVKKTIGESKISDFARKHSKQLKTHVAITPCIF